MRTFSIAGLAAHLAIVSLGFAQEPCKSTVVGDLHIERLQSKTYGASISVRVWLPPGYGDATNNKRKYPTLYLLDGQTAFDECTAFKGEHELQVDETVTRLMGEHKIPAIIVVGIDSTERRSQEYSPYKDTIADAGAPEPIGKQLPSFFADELIPFVAARYRVSNDAAHTGIGGTSLGGAAALYLSLNRPDLFGLALLQSPTLMLGNGQLLRDTALLARAPDRVAIGVGNTELDFPKVDQWLGPMRLAEKDAETGIVKMTEVLASNLRAAYLKRPEIMLVVEPNANHSSVSWARRIPDAITFLFGDSKTAD